MKPTIFQDQRPGASADAPSRTSMTTLFTPCKIYEWWRRFAVLCNDFLSEILNQIIIFWQSEKSGKIPGILDQREYIYEKFLVARLWRYLYFYIAERSSGLNEKW